MFIYQIKKHLLSLILLLVLSSAINYAIKAETAVAESGRSARVLNVAAASDLQNAFNKIGEEFEKKYGVKVILNFGSTGLLARQIENGAPVDVFAAASMKYINTLDEKNVITGDSVRKFARGRLALVYKNGLLKTPKPQELLKNDIKRFAVANPGHAPYGEAAVDFLKNAGLWSGLQDKLVYGNNVAEVLRYVKTENAEAGIAALSLVINNRDVSYVALDEKLYGPIEQGVAIVRGTGSRQDAEKFIAYLNSNEAKKILQKFGFITD